MIEAWRLFTGDDGHSHVERTALDLEAVVRAATLGFRETPAQSTANWHNAPGPRLIITLSGSVELATRAGERFTVGPGDVLLAMDDTGTGHTWRLLDDQPWRRAYLAAESGFETLHLTTEHQ